VQKVSWRIGEQRNVGVVTGQGALEERPYGLGGHFVLIASRPICPGYLIKASQFQRAKVLRGRFKEAEESGQF